MQCKPALLISYYTLTLIATERTLIVEVSTASTLTMQLLYVCIVTTPVQIDTELQVHAHVAGCQSHAPDEKVQSTQGRSSEHSVPAHCILTADTRNSSNTEIATKYGVSVNM